MEFLKWLEINNAYKYYHDYFRRVISNDSFSFNFEENFYNEYSSICELSYEGYIIAMFTIEKKRLVLITKNSIGSNSENPIQQKLIHEFIEYFKLNVEEKKHNYYLSQSKFYDFDKYVEKVTHKIDMGFEKFMDLLKLENLNYEDIGYIKISTNSYYSFASLSELLTAYNKLYSLIDFIYSNDVETIEKKVKNISIEKSLVLESVHIASEGFLLALGQGVLINIISELIKFVLSGTTDYKKYREYKEKLVKKVEKDQSFLEERRYVRELIYLLDDHIKKIDNCNNEISYYIKNEIDFLVNKIEELQGITRFELQI